MAEPAEHEHDGDGLRVFLCHASEDKPAVRELYDRLRSAGYHPWLDEEDLLPGQRWEEAILEAVRDSHVVVVCLSKGALTKEGFVQKEIEFALDAAKEKPEGTIYLIPARLEDCDVPKRLSRWHVVNLYRPQGFGRLLRSLARRARGVGIEPAVAEPTGQRDTDGLELIHVPAGTFAMGEGVEAHEVSVEAFRIGKYQVTNQQWKAFVEANPTWRRGKAHRQYHDGDYLKHWKGDSYPGDKADHPVTWVSWFAAKTYCEWTGGRLPTEAEWEYACRAGSSGTYCFGDDASKLGEYAWYGGNSGGSTHPVGHKAPNVWGIHDMHGNVWEWCSSKYQPYPYRADDGREDLEGSGSVRVLRGGSWSYFDHCCRSTTRYFNVPTFTSYFIGFRLCVSARAPS